MYRMVRVIAPSQSVDTAAATWCNQGDGRSQPSAAATLHSTILIFLIPCNFIGVLFAPCDVILHDNDNLGLLPHHNLHIVDPLGCRL